MAECLLYRDVWRQCVARYLRCVDLCSLMSVSQEWFFFWIDDRSWVHQRNRVCARFPALQALFKAHAAPPPELVSRKRKFLAKHRATARIVEVHSFPASTLQNEWNTLPASTLVVVLTMHQSDADTLEQRVIEAVPGAATLAGDRVVNDIGYEAERNGWGNRHVLLEMRRDLTATQSDAILDGVVVALSK
jgi:hypothetical protein